MQGMVWVAGGYDMSALYMSHGVPAGARSPGSSVSYIKQRSPGSKFRLSCA